MIAFVFPGGHDAQLAHSVQSTFGGSVVVEHIPDRQWPAVSVQAKSKPELWNKIQAWLRCAGGFDGKSNSVGIGSRAYSLRVLPTNGRWNFPAPEPWTPGSAFSGRQAVLAPNLVRLNKEPVKIHWLYENMPIVLAGERKGEAFWRAFCLAVGAKFGYQNPVMVVKVDYPEFRKRVWGSRRWPTNLEIQTDATLKDLFSRAAIVEATDKQLQIALARPTSTCTMKIATNSRLSQIAQLRFKRFLDDPKFNPATLHGSFVQDIDPNLGFGALLCATSEVSSLAFGKQGNGRLFQFPF